MRIKSRSVKARTSFGNYRTGKLLSTAKEMSAGLRKNPLFQGEWVGCPSSLDKLDEAIAKVDETYVASKTGGSNVIAMRLDYEDDLRNHMTTTIHYVSMVAHGDEKILRESGVPLLKQPVKTASGPSVPPVVNLIMKHGGLEGLLIASCTRVPGNCSYRLMICTGDPTLEESWSQVKIAGKASGIEVPNLKPGTKYYFRVQVISPDGTHGPWSQVVSIIAL